MLNLPFFLCAFLISLLSCKTAPAQASEIEQAPSAFSINTSFAAPVTFFSLTGKANESAQNWVASFSPSSSPIIGIGVSYRFLNLGYARKIDTASRFQAVAFDVPFGIWNVGVFWRQYLGFREQTQLRNRIEKGSSFEFSYGAPAADRGDIEFSNAGLHADARLPIVTLPVEKSDVLVDLEFLASASVQKETLHAGSSLIPLADQALFGAGADLNTFSSAGLGLSMGGGLQFRLSPHSTAYLDLLGGGKVMGVRTLMGVSEDTRLALAPAIVGTIGWRFRSFETSISLEASEVSLNELKYSTFHLGLLTSYRYVF